MFWAQSTSTDFIRAEQISKQQKMMTEDKHANMRKLTHTQTHTHPGREQKNTPGNQQQKKSKSVALHVLCHVLHVSLVLKCSYSTPFCQPRYIRYRELTWFKVQLFARFVISHLGLGIYTLNGWLHFFQLHRAKQMVMTTGGVTGGGGWGWDITSTRNNQVTVQALCCKRKN